MGSCVSNPNNSKQESPKVKQQIYDYGSNIDVSDLCAGLSYFLVLPFKPLEANYATRIDTVPYLITFNDERTTIKEIIAQYKVMNKQVTDQSIQFALQNGQAVMQNWAIRDLSLYMGRNNVNGLNLFTNEIYNYEGEQTKIHLPIQGYYGLQKECSVSNYLSNQASLRTNYLSLIVQIQVRQSQKEVITVSINEEASLKDLKNLILTQINKQFGTKLDIHDISDIFNIETKMALDAGKSLVRQKVYDNSIVIVPIQNAGVKLTRLRGKDYNSYITIYKEGEQDPKRFRYSKISQMTFSQLYVTYLEISQSRYRKQLQYGLKITDMIIKPHEKISIAQIYFKNQNKQPLNVVAKVVNQKMVFYHLIPGLLKSEEEFILQHYIKIPVSQKQNFQSVRRTSKQLISKSSIEPQRQISFEPILFYTSPVKVYEGQPQIADKIYKILNIFLRQSQFLTLQQNKIKQEWKYIYCSAILKQLQDIPAECNLKTYRGVSYDPICGIGKILTFKQFLSTSRKKQTALKFSIVGKNPVKILLELDIEQGYPIKDYSVFPNEDQLMLQPFTEFEVVDITQTEQAYNMKFYTVKTYFLKQIMTSKKLPSIKANLLIWIDDKPKEGAKIFNLIKVPRETVMLIQLLSTQQLAKWLNKNQYLFKDPTAQFLFITNMARRQNEKPNQMAGIEGLKEIRRYSQSVPVFFFIGNLESTNKKLQECSVDTSHITVSASAMTLYNFIMEIIGS